MGSVKGIFVAARMMAVIEDSIQFNSRDNKEKSI